MQPTIGDTAGRPERPRAPFRGPGRVARLRRTDAYLRSVGATYGVHVPDQDQPANEWARLLRDITERPGWSVAKLARESGVHRSTIFRWIRGDVQNLTLESIRLIAEAAQIDREVAIRAAATLQNATPNSGSLPLDEAEELIINQAGLTEQQKQNVLRWYRKYRQERLKQQRADLEAAIELMRHTG